MNHLTTAWDTHGPFKPQCWTRSDLPEKAVGRNDGVPRKAWKRKLDGWEAQEDEAAGIQLSTNVDLDAMGLRETFGKLLAKQMQIVRQEGPACPQSENPGWRENLVPLPH